MIVDVLLFWLAVSVFFGLAALLAEDALRALRLPTRWIWLAALWAPGALLFGAWALPALAPVAESSGVWPTAVFELPGLEVGPADSSAWFAVTSGLLALWIASGAVVLFGLLRSHVRLRRGRTTWPTVDVGGASVHLSEDVGPAVAGVVRPWIVLPAWSLDLPTDELELIVLHEEQHLAGHDTRVLAFGLVAVVAAAWNPVSWWQLRRLRVAMEVDCDRRVLREEPDVRPYGSSLLRVAAQNSGVSMGLAAFVERPNNIKRRILAMTHVPTRWSALRASGSMALALTLALIGCSVDSPVNIDDRDAQTVDLPAGAIEQVDDIRAQPTFTPFTVAPSILNRQVVVDRMQAEYPALLRDAGIGGTVRVYFFINEEGLVEQVRIDQSSGHPAIDEAAINVAGAYEFSPALNGEEPTPVWVSFPITFRVDGPNAERPSN